MMPHKKNIGISRRALFFGTFDGLHEGHLAALRAARSYTRELIVVVARDRAVTILKGRAPKRNQHARAASVRCTRIPEKVILGDAKQGTYGVIFRTRPDLICIGYDQSALHRDILEKIKARNIPSARIRVLKSHRPRTFHSSILKRRIAS